MSAPWTRAAPSGTLPGRFPSWSWKRARLHCQALRQCRSRPQLGRVHSPRWSCSSFNACSIIANIFHRTDGWEHQQQQLCCARWLRHRQQRAYCPRETTTRAKTTTITAGTYRIEIWPITTRWHHYKQLRENENFERLKEKKTLDLTFLEKPTRLEKPTKRDQGEAPNENETESRSKSQEMIPWTQYQRRAAMKWLFLPDYKSWFLNYYKFIGCCQ